MANGEGEEYEKWQAAWLEAMPATLKRQRRRARAAKPRSSSVPAESSTLPDEGAHLAG